MKKAILTSCVALFSAFASAQTDVAPYQPGVTLDGVTYCLPRTAFRVVVTAEKTTYTPGEFCKYADRYLRLRDISPESNTQWKLKTVSMEAYGTPDPSKKYTIRLNPKTVAPLVELTEDGILLSINTEGEEETLGELPQGTKPGKRVNPRDFMNQEMLSSGSTAKMAELVAQEIYTIRESRNALTRGEAENTPKDGKQLELMLKHLSQQEEAYLELFKGFSETSTEVYSFIVEPSTELDKDVLFRFSSKLGIVDKDDLSGEPIYISIKDLKVIPEPVYDEKTAKKKVKLETGVYYNVPGRAQIRIHNQSQTFVEGEYPMGQFGKVEILSNVLFDKKNSTKVTFHQLSGGIRTIKDK